MGIMVYSLLWVMQDLYHFISSSVCLRVLAQGLQGSVFRSGLRGLRVNGFRD